MISRATSILVGALFLLLSACAAAPHEVFEQEYRRAQSLSAEGRSTEAIQAYRAAIAAYPQSPDAYNNLGALLYDVGQTAAAIPEYRKALQLRPNFPAARNNLGVALLSSGQIVESVAEFRKAVEANPRFVQARFNLCLGLEILDQLEEALAQCRAAADINAAQPGLQPAIDRLQTKLQQF